MESLKDNLSRYKETKRLRLKEIRRSYIDRKNAKELKKANDVKSDNKREKERIRKQNYRTQLKLKRETIDITNAETPFQNRTSKHRAIRKLKLNLPKSPLKRKLVLEHCLKQIPDTNEQCDRNKEKQSLGESVLADIKSVIDESKYKRSVESMQAMSGIVASVSGESIESNGKKKKLAKSLGLPARRISQGRRIRTQVFKSGQSCLDFTKRKTRKDAIPENVKKIVHDYWLKPENSRPSGNKSDIKRQRIARNEYVSHMAHVLEKTQSEIYNDFKNEYPEIKISLRKFETLKPFYVRSVRVTDKETCCCKQHVEIKTVFRSCMKYRKDVLNEKNDDGLDETFPIFERIEDMFQTTLCEKDRHTNISCLKRECVLCGSKNLKFLPEERSVSEGTFVKWERFEKTDVVVKGGKSVKKDILVKKESAPGVMFEYLKKLIEHFPFHQQKAQWQHAQYKAISANLPMNSCVCAHDFSENYACSEKQELQSSYFMKTEASIHVTVLHRHSVLEHDGYQSTIENPKIIQEYFYVLSPDLQHDQYFVHDVRKLVHDYLVSINYDCYSMHEFTDGCSVQYKSRHCLGDISKSMEWYEEFSRSYFETSHGKGAHDAAGGLLKRQADLAVLRGKCQIQNATQLYNFATENLLHTKTQRNCRVFRYLENINRNTPISYKPVPSIRSVHSVRLVPQSGKLLIGELSCFSCARCVTGDYQKCANIPFVGKLREHVMEVEGSVQETVTPGQVIAIFTDEGSNYYLMKVSRSCHTSATITRDSWGCTIAPGIVMFKGYYYDLKHIGGSSTYKLLKTKEAAVPAASLLYVCNKIEGLSSIHLPSFMHEEILARAVMSQK